MTQKAFALLNHFSKFCSHFAVKKVRLIPAKDIGVNAIDLNPMHELLTTETIWAIIDDTIDDATVNRLVWESLGYRYDEATKKWDTTKVAPTWQDKYPEPPDFIDSRAATIQLTRSIPVANKQLLKEKLGFKGYKLNELNPRRTRRATAASWLLSYMQDVGQ